MKKKLLVISGWAHSIKSIQPMGDRLSKKFDTTLISGTDALAMERLPENDFIAWANEAKNNYAINEDIKTNETNEEIIISQNNLIKLV